MLISSAFAGDPSPRFPAAVFQRDEPTEVDLLRVTEGGPRIYVQARFPDGSSGLFLVDTGADISVLQRETAERLGLELDEDYGAIVGLGGSSRTDRATLPFLDFGAQGETRVEAIELAVGVPGFQDHAGAMPLDGLLGNNVWSRFVLELDYPADRMVLHQPNSVRLKPRKSGEMYFDGQHVFAPLEIQTAADPEVVHRITLRIDTGAGELSFCGPGIGVADSWTVGLEPIFGLGASSSLPFFQNLRMTRRIQLQEVRLADQSIPTINSARWMNYDGAGHCPDNLVGLAGHKLLAGHRVWFDYGNHRLQLGKSKRKPRQLNGHQVMLDQDIAAHGDSEERAFYRARLQLGLGNYEAAAKLLNTALSDPDNQDEARVLLAATLREQGDLEGSWQALQSMSPAALVEQHEVVAIVNGLLFRERHDEALQLAKAATIARPDETDGWVALSDVYLWSNEPDAAHQALLRAVKAEQHPDAHLLRRARVALAAGDLYGSMAHVRKLMQLYPMGGETIWFYAQMLDSDAARQTFRFDLDQAMKRVHPEARPLDFLVAVHHIVGDDQQAAKLMEQGIEQDCAPAEGAAQDNCLAWYWSLAGVRPDLALSRIQRALSEGDRADYLDTLAMVRLARGETREAHNAALAAARRQPDNVYMLWQADRLKRLANESR